MEKCSRALPRMKKLGTKLVLQTSHHKIFKKDLPTYLFLNWIMSDLAWPTYLKIWRHICMFLYENLTLRTTLHTYKGRSLWIYIYICIWRLFKVEKMGDWICRKHTVLEQLCCTVSRKALNYTKLDDFGGSIMLI